MVGWEPLTTIDSMADNIELDGEQAEYLETEAALLLLEETGRLEFRPRIADLTRMRDELKGKLADMLGAAQL